MTLLVSYVKKGTVDPMSKHKKGARLLRRRGVGIDSRLRRLEEQGHRCPECELAPYEHGRPVAVYEERPDKGFDGDPDERCGCCGRPLYTVLRVVYDSPASEATEGGGLT
jgi:hypothetical protein